MWQEISTAILVSAAIANVIFQTYKMLKPKKQHACGCAGACSMKEAKGFKPIKVHAA